MDEAVHTWEHAREIARVVRDHFARDEIRDAAMHASRSRDYDQNARADWSHLNRLLWARSWGPRALMGRRIT